MNIKGYRASLNMTQKQVADQLGINRETYRRKENNANRFTLEEAMNLARIFGISIEELHQATMS